MKKQALLSVWDKTGIIELAQVLRDYAIKIIATKGTGAELKKSGIDFVEVSDYTGSPEILSGRVKTLHPKIAAGILSLRDSPEIEPIDIVVVNLYPFEEALKKNLSREEQLELIDIGGVTLLRAAAKNYQYCTPVPGKEFYPLIIDELKRTGEISLPIRELLAQKTFEIIAHYDSIINEYYYRQFQKVDFPYFLNKSFVKSLPLRYGENPHQKAFFYSDPFSSLQISQLAGKELSFNNLLDIDSVINILEDFQNVGQGLEKIQVCVIVKHNTPCGVAIGKDSASAYEQAFLTDPKSAFGGIVGFSKMVDEVVAEKLLTQFYEVIVAQEFTRGAIELLKKKKSLRLIEYQGEVSKMELRTALGGILYEERDLIKEEDWQVVSKKRPTEEELSDLRFAFKVVKSVRSNGIVLAKNGQTVGIGAGQMSRIDAVELAIKKGLGREKGAVLASDGFFPFRDSIDLAASVGITSIVEPGGSVRDEEVIKAADEHNLSLIFTKTRHFRH